LYYDKQIQQQRNVDAAIERQKKRINQKETHQDPNKDSKQNRKSNQRQSKTCSFVIVI